MLAAPAPVSLSQSYHPPAHTVTCPTASQVSVSLRQPGLVMFTVTVTELPTRPTIAESGDGHGVSLSQPGSHIVHPPTYWQ